MEAKKQQALAELKFSLNDVSRTASSLKNSFNGAFHGLAETLILNMLEGGDDVNRINDYAISVLRHLADNARNVDNTDYFEVADVLRMSRTLKYLSIGVLGRLIDTENLDISIIAMNNIAPFTDGEIDEWRRLYSSELIPEDIREMMNHGIRRVLAHYKQLEDSELDF